MFIIHCFESIYKNSSDTYSCRLSLSGLIETYQTSDSDRIDSLISFLTSIYSFLEFDDANEENPRSNTVKKNVVVVGGGPAGLLNAITAYRAGMNVQLFEKRRNYTRNTWFDIGPEKLYPGSLSFLFGLGLKYQNLEYVVTNTEYGETYTIRCQSLERFLSKILVIIGVNVHYGYSFREVSRVVSDIKNTKKDSTSTNTKTHFKSHFDIEPPEATSSSIGGTSAIGTAVPFDLLIGADGMHSEVRSHSSIPFEKVTTFNLLNKYVRTVQDGLHQYSLMCSFHAIDGECPMIEKDDDGRDVDYLQPSFVVDGVTSVFKRWYFGHCHFQILFNNDFVYTKILGKEQHDFGRSANIEEFPILWNILLNVTNILFSNKTDNIEQLKTMVSKKDDGTKYDAKLIKTSLHQVPQTCKILSSDVVPDIPTITTTTTTDIGGRNNTGDNAESDPAAGVILVGDAQSVAHYRLGIGVNHILINLPHLHEFFKNISGQKHSFTASMEHLNRSFSKHLDDMSQIQASTIYYEAYCNLVVTFEDGLLHPVIWKRQGASQLQELSNAKILQSCMGK
eukprot:TRINITY_DN10319_c0_g1_i1.p1 TRINITY_DN10319_c0_g1~~TRINITY_DN10319_c0_g1_i1.p1  ORF type:complete len:563 (+),score=86.49 TRINITY_DN10319_c0_g1_i1:150-1838(+)